MLETALDQLQYYWLMLLMPRGLHLRLPKFVKLILVNKSKPMKWLTHLTVCSSWCVGPQGLNT